MTFSKALVLINVLRTFFLPQTPSALAAIGSSVPGHNVFNVVGWPTPNLGREEPPLSLGDEPVVGRQICPPLTRTNLTHKKSEDLLIRRVQESIDVKGTMWTFDLKPGLYWWGGELATAQHLAIFLEKQMGKIVAERGGGLWQLPSFRVETDGNLQVVLTWNQKPIFGPYILSGAPFFRPLSPEDQEVDVKYECVGLYRPRTRENHLVLIPTKSYKSNQFMPEIWLYSAGSLAHENTNRFLDFRSPQLITVENLGNDPQNTCSLSVDLPLATMILWNTKNGPTKAPEFRRILSQLVPRAALVRGGTGLMADGSGSFVPQSHPAYRTGMDGRLFDMQRVALELDQLGFLRTGIGGLRKNAEGKILKLTLRTETQSAGIVEKVLSDTFSAAGISVHFTNRMNDGGTPDGVLSAFFLDWPRINLLGNFHSQSRSPEPFWTLDHRELDRYLEEYALSLTREFPDFSKLSGIQHILYDLEPLTMVFHHRSCVVSGTGIRPLGKEWDLADPDWFRQMLF